MVFRDFVWKCVILCGNVVQYGTVCYCVVLGSTVLCYVVLCGFLAYCVALCGTVWCCVVVLLCCTVSYYVVLFSS